MAETKFTKGPWEVRRSAQGYPYQIHAPNGTHVKDVTRWAAISVPSLPEGEANSHLIAAAPELYEALTRFSEPIVEVIGEGKLVRCVFCSYGWDPNGKDKHYKDCPTNKTRSALAKARGEV